jgi:hypothetical protein
MEVGSGTVGDMAHWSPPLLGGKIWSCRTRGTPAPSLVGRQGSEPRFTWHTGALPCKEAGSGATVHVVVPELFLSERRDLEPLDTW